MEAIIEKKSKWFWLNLLAERGTLSQEKIADLKRSLASGKVVYNPLVGLISKVKLDELIKTGVIVKRKTDWAIPADEIIKNGKKILVVSKKYTEWDNRARAMRGATYHNQEATDDLIDQEETTKELDKLFLDNTSI